MSKLRLSTLSLTIAMVVISLGYVSPSFAGKKCDNDPTHPSCKDAGGDAEFTAALTMGGFTFTAVPVAPNKRGTSYRSNITLTMIRPGGDEFCETDYCRAAWDAVFSACMPELLSDPIDRVFVGRDNWRIVNSGGNVSGNADSAIRITFNDVDVDVLDVVLDGAVVFDFSLFGELGSDPFLPEPGHTSVFTLVKAQIFGQDKNLSCKSGNFVLLVDSKLEIRNILEN